LIPFIFLRPKGKRSDLRSGMNLGADDYLTKPVANDDLVQAIEARLSRSAQQAKREFKPDVSSAEPLRKLGLTARANRNSALAIPGQDELGQSRRFSASTESTVKKHVAGNIRKSSELNPRRRHRASVGSAQLATTMNWRWIEQATPAIHPSDSEGES